MKYDIIKLWHNIAKNWNFGRNIPRTEIKSTATCNSISPLYIFPCKLELISRRANKEEIALSLSPDQIRSSKMAVHFFWIIWQGKLISETICCWTQCQVRPSKMDVHFLDQVAGDENAKPYLWNHFFDPNSGRLIKDGCAFSLDQVYQEKEYHFFLGKVMVNSH